MDSQRWTTHGNISYTSIIQFSAFSCLFATEVRSRYIIKNPPRRADCIVLIQKSEQGCEDQGNDGHQLDKDIDGRTRGVLEGVAHGVAYNGSGMSFGSLTAMGSTFDIFLGIVPGAASVGHEDSHENTGNQGSSQQASQGFGP